MKKTAATLVLCVLMLVAMPLTAFAHGHGGGHHRMGYRSVPSVSWHEATDYYSGHYSNRCVQYDHSWHLATDTYSGHYSYACNDYGHAYYHDVCNNGYHH